MDHPSRSVPAHPQSLDHNFNPLQEGVYVQSEPSPHDFLDCSYLLKVEACVREERRYKKGVWVTYRTAEGDRERRVALTQVCFSADLGKGGIKKGE